MKYIYGPVHSRRLGLSLGVSLTPYKTCSFDCIYCQQGNTTNLTLERKDYLFLEDILIEINTWINQNPSEASQLNYITLSGAGEPTLHIKVGEFIRKIKQLVPVQVAVITNSSLLADSKLRQELQAADLIVPSLDAADPKAFLRIDRPAEAVSLEAIILGLISLRKEFRGQIWLEVMLVKGINDDLRYIKKLKDAIELINPDKIQLNSPVRSTAMPGVLPVESAKLKKIKKILGEKCEII